MTSLEQLEADLYHLPGDWALKIELASECCWSAEARWTPEPNTHTGPDISLVTYAVGGNTAEEVATEAVHKLIALAQHPPHLLPSPRYQPVPVTTNSEQLPAPREA